MSPEQQQQQQQQQTPEEIRREIERTRQELGDTVDALSHKANVKEQARIKKDEVQERVSANPVPLAAVVGGGIVLLLLLRLLRKR
jgi:Protein of unknown function (DUF3618)